MNDITFKIARKGEEKTRWLLDVAKYYVNNRRRVFLFTDDEQEYARFCEKYFKMFSEVCEVQRLTSFQLTSDDVVLVDDLFSHCTSIGDFNFMKRNCYKMFVTLEGTDTFETEDTTWNDFYEQLTMDIQEVIRA